MTEQPPRPGIWARLPLIGKFAVGAVLGLVVVSIAVGLGGGGAAATPGPTSAAVATPTTAPPVATATPPATPVPTAIPTPAPVDPATALTAWKAAFWEGYGDLYKNDMADVLQSSYVIFSSIDKVTYDEAKNVIRFDVTSDYEDLYNRRPDELQDDAWEIYRDYGREIWLTIMDGIGSEPAAGVTPDWATWSPALIFVGDRMRLSCPGRFIVSIANRDATQADFVKNCKISS